MPEGDHVRKMLVGAPAFAPTVVEDPWHDVPTEKNIHGIVASGLADLHREVADGCESRCVLLLGEVGLGKTHLIMRLNRTAGAKGLFVYVPPFHDPDRPFLHVLRCIATCLSRHAAPGEPTSLARFANHVRSTAVANILDARPPFRGSSLFHKLAAAFRQNPAVLHRFSTQPQTRSVLAATVAAYHRSRDARIDPDCAKVLVDLLDPGLTPLATRWLQGAELHEDDLESLDVLRAVRDEGRCFDILRSLGCLASTYDPLVLAFDRIEVLETGDVDKAVFMALGETVARIRKEVPSVLLLFSCTGHTWETRFKKHVRASVIERMEEASFTLQPLRQDEVEALVAMRLDRIVPREERPWVTWPFPATVMEQVGATPAPRSVLKKASEFLDIWRKDPAAADWVFGRWANAEQRSVRACFSKPSEKTPEPSD